jgi:membrane-bound lytic murein transglycosylase A
MGPKSRRGGVPAYVTRLFLLSGLGLGLAACAQVVPPDKVLLKPASFTALPGWNRDDPGGALTAFLRSCRKLAVKSPNTPIGPQALAGRAGDWRAPCGEARKLAARGADGQSARHFFERRFRPFQVIGSKGDEGLFTAYFEISLKGARRKSAHYHVPLYRRPGDLVTANLGVFSRKWRGRSIAGRVKRGRLVPYDDRSAIKKGALTGKRLELLWLDDPVDAFFLHIQGSGRVELNDGTVTRVGYAGKNGHVYTSIGRVLIKMGELQRGTVTMQSIRAWLAGNPKKAEDVLNRNRSFVFFREITGPGPIGSQGVALIPERSLAVDRAFMPLGVPMFVAADNPDGDIPPVRRLMVAQDTGGAIRGQVRGDLFLGHGRKAADIAGRTRMRGRYWILLPLAVAEGQLAAQ